MMMSYFLLLVFIGLAAATVSQDPISGAAAKCDRSKCDWVILDHYRAMDCEAVYENGACCPTKYNCKTEAERNLLPSKCYYKGVEYNDGDEVPVTHECSVRCRCRSNPRILEGASADVECVNIECPSLFRRPEPNCRSIYESGKCCSIDKECTTRGTFPAVVRSDEKSCEAEGKTYKYGDQMSFFQKPNTCQTCVCSAAYTNPTGLGCKKIDCGLDFRYRRQLSGGQVPVYLTCCPVGWLKPDDKKISEKQAAIDETKPFCRFGKLKIALGAPLATSDKTMSCSCAVPPLPTCRYVGQK